MKNYIFAVTLIVGLLINSACYAGTDIYLGVYDNGYRAYLDTSSIKYFDEFKNGYLMAEGFKCLVKKVSSNGGFAGWVSYKYQFGPQVELLDNYTLRQMSALYKQTGSVELNLVLYLRELFKQTYGNSAH